MPTNLIGKPVVKNTTAFDVNNISSSPYIINFTWSGQKCNGNRLTIIETGYVHDITGLSSTYHVLSQQICNSLNLVNGKTYHATITMLDFEGNPISNASDQFLIYCYSTPAFSIRGLADNLTIIKASEFTALLNYKSSDGMELLSYRFNLYDGSGTILLDNSNELYILPDENTTDYATCSHTFKGLENNKSYVMEAIGTTVYGMEVKCTYPITINTSALSIYNITSATATKDGNIHIGMSYLPMGYETSGSIKYVDGEEIDLRSKDNHVKYTLMKPLKNFKCKFKFRALKYLTKPILSFSDSSGNCKSIISIIPDIRYVHGTIAYSSDIDTTTLIRPQIFTYNNQEYIDYIDHAYIVLRLCSDTFNYVVNSNFIIDLLYDAEKDKFYLDEQREFIAEVVRANGNFSLNVAEINKEKEG